MRRVLPLLVLCVGAACAERSKSDEAPTPPAEPTPPAAIAQSARPATSAPLVLRKLDGMHRINIVRPPSSLTGAPAVVAAKDGAAD